MSDILRYEHVNISYSGTRVVRDISFSLKEGEILGIAGESGSGKSTLIRAAMGLLGRNGLVTGGDILFKGMNLTDLSERKRREINGPEIGMIFQNAGASFCPVRTLEDQLYESLNEHERVSRPEFRKRAEELLFRIGLEDPGGVLKRYPFELSGGMQQRFGIAAAILLKPCVLLADEPTSALDVSVQKQVVEVMRKVRDDFGTSIILVTHNIGVIGALADRVLVMKDGEMVEYGEKEQVLKAPREPYTRRLMAAVPRLRR